MLVARCVIDIAISSILVFHAIINLRAALCEGKRTLGSISPEIARLWVMFILGGSMWASGVRAFSHGSYLDKCSRPHVEDTKRIRASDEFLFATFCCLDHVC